jgi:hypothetical protein
MVTVEIAHTNRQLWLERERMLAIAMPKPGTFCPNTTSIATEVEGGVLSCKEDFRERGVKLPLLRWIKPSRSVNRVEQTGGLFGDCANAMLRS